MIENTPDLVNVGVAYGGGRFADHIWRLEAMPLNRIGWSSNKETVPLSVLLIHAAKVIVFCFSLGYDVEYAVILPEL